jgi:hypothetical protein
MFPSWGSKFSRARNQRAAGGRRYIPEDGSILTFLGESCLCCPEYGQPQGEFGKRNVTTKPDRLRYDSYARVPRTISPHKDISSSSEKTLVHYTWYQFTQFSIYRQNWLPNLFGTASRANGFLPWTLRSKFLESCLRCILSSSLLETQSRKPRIRPCGTVALTIWHPLPQKLTLTSPISGSGSVGVARSRTKATEFVVYSRDPRFLECALVSHQS